MIRRSVTVSLGVLALSVGVFVMGYQGSAQAANPTLEQILAAITQLQTSVNNLPTSVNLSGVTPNWDKNLPSASRFTVLTAFNNQAVRDNNTGLVWEQAPDATTRPWGGAGGATTYCVSKTVGGATGWRLPSVVELKSVQDPSLAAPFVPASVFSGVQSALYWSAATVADIPTTAWDVHFGDGSVSLDSKPRPTLAWCVRGPMQEAVY